MKSQRTEEVSKIINCDSVLYRLNRRVYGEVTYSPTKVVGAHAIATTCSCLIYVVLSKKCCLCYCHNFECGCSVSGGGIMDMYSSVARSTTFLPNRLCFFVYSSRMAWIIYIDYLLVVWNK